MNLFTEHLRVTASRFLYKIQSSMEQDKYKYEYKYFKEKTEVKGFVIS